MRRSAYLALLIFAFSGVVQAQIRIVLPKKHFAVDEPISVKIVNVGRNPVTYCLNWNFSSKLPIPFYMQNRQGRRWSTLLNGVDVGEPLRGAEILDPGDSREFSFHLHDTGRTRLIFQYWLGEKDHSACKEPRKFTTLKSAVFYIEPTP